MTIKNYLVCSGLVIALFAAMALFTTHAFGLSVQVPGVTDHTINPPLETMDYYTFFTATTTTATSTTASSPQDPGYLRIGGAKDVLFYFSRGDTKGTGNSGSSIFKVQVTPDRGLTWYDYNELGQVTISSTDNAFYTRQGTTTISAATSTQMWAMEDINFYGVRCIVQRITDGESTCTAAATF